MCLKSFIIICIKFKKTFNSVILRCLALKLIMQKLTEFHWCFFNTSLYAYL